jgi:hypothetical protein
MENAFSGTPIRNFPFLYTIYRQDSREIYTLPKIFETSRRRAVWRYPAPRRWQRIWRRDWGKRGARLNDIAPGIIVTPLAVDEFNGPRGDFYKNMFANCPAGRPGTADEVANVAELLMSDKGAFITGSTILMDGGATASYFYGPLKPETSES